MEVNTDLAQSEIVLTDICSKSNKKIQYVKFNDDSNVIHVKASTNASKKNLQYLYSLLKDIFLPKGYPNSVSSDYTEYQIWDTCQAFCSSICGILSMQAVMKGIGVGSEAASPMLAVVTWIMKDGTGMLGSILFVWLKGSKLDSDCKKWRLFADILNDAAMFIELCIPTFIDYSLYILCVATTFKALVGTAGSSTRAALITHQAIRENIADVSAKDGSQEVFVNLFSYVFGIFLLKNLADTNQIWTVMYTAAFFHLLFNYKAVKCLKINVFNGERLRLSLRTYLPTSCVPTIEQVNRRESVFLGLGTSDVKLCGFTIVFGCSIRKAVESHEFTFRQFTAFVAAFQDKKYFILAETNKKVLYVAFRLNFTESDVLKAYFHAVLLGAAISYLLSNKKDLHIVTRSRKHSPMARLRNILEGHPLGIHSGSTTNQLKDAMITKAYTSCDDFIEKEFTTFSRMCIREGWNVHKHLINIDDWRADWKYVPPPEKVEVTAKRLEGRTLGHKKHEKSGKSKFIDYSNLIIS